MKIFFAFAVLLFVAGCGSRYIGQPYTEPTNFGSANVSQEVYDSITWGFTREKALEKIQDNAFDTYAAAKEICVKWDFNDAESYGSVLSECFETHCDGWGNCHCHGYKITWPFQCVKK